LGCKIILGLEGLVKQKREDKFIALAGMVGVGKTTLTRILGEWKPEIFIRYEEPETTNPYLAGQYAAVAKNEYSPDVFNSQFVFLLYKTRNLVDLWLRTFLLREDQQLWLDRTIYEDAEIFARGLIERGLMSADETERYMLSYNAALLLVPRPRILYVLEASPKICNERAEKDLVRGSDILPPNLDYYVDLHRRYSTWLNEFEAAQQRFPLGDRTRVVRIDTNHINLHQLGGQNSVLKIVADSLREEGLINSSISEFPERVLVPYNGRS
jgi:deoxyadenosine/deoxycytidine kinase